MDLRPSDLEHKTFRVTDQGYDPNEVHRFLEQVARHLAALEQRVATLEDDLVVDVRGDEVAVEVDATPTAPPNERQSRYVSRSAHLPHLGKDAGSVLGSMETLRPKPGDEDDE